MMLLREWILSRFPSQVKHPLPVLEAVRMIGEQVEKRYPLINSGGCCIYAASLGAELARRGIPCSVFVAALSNAARTCSLLDMRQQLSNPYDALVWQRNGVDFHHLGLEFEHSGQSYMCDTNRIQPTSDTFERFAVYQGRFTVDEADKLAGNASGWNEAFDRKHIPYIRKNMAFFLNQTLPISA